MYSDNQFEDLAYDHHQQHHNRGNGDGDDDEDDSNNTFDLNLQLNMNNYVFNNNDDLEDDENINHALLQTIKRHTSTSNNNNFGYLNQHHDMNLNMSSNNNDENDDSIARLGNALLGSPQPSTIKKLKSHLSGIGGIGGYLTSPMGSFRSHMNTNNNNASASSNDTPSSSSNIVGSSVFSVLKPSAGSSNMRYNSNSTRGGNLPSSPLKPLSSNNGGGQSSSNGEVHCFELRSNVLPPMPLPLPQQQQQQQQQGQQGQQQTQTQQIYQLQSQIQSGSSYALDPALAAPSMMRYQSAPTSTSMSSQQASTSASTSGTSNNNNTRASSRSKRSAGVNNNNKLNVPQNGNADANGNNSNAAAASPSASAASFNEMDYGGMRIYGRPIQRGTSEDPSSSSYSNNNNHDALSIDNNGTAKATSGGGFLPYPDQLPTITLGRGVKNSRDLSNPMNHSSFPMSKSDSEPIPSISTSTSTSSTNGANASSSTGMKKQFTNLDKPFIQYVAPNSPAAKAAARNKKSLTVQTSTQQQTGQQQQDNQKGTGNGKMIPIKMANNNHYNRLEMPLTPPISATYNNNNNNNNPASPSHSHHSQHNNNNDNGQTYQTLQYASSQQMQPSSSNSLYPDPNTLQYQQQQQQQQSNGNGQYLSPVKNTFDFSNDAQGGIIIAGNGMGSAQMPSFEFSLEQFGNGSPSTLNNGNNNDNSSNGYNHNNAGNDNGLYNGNAIDFSSVLGLPSPHQLSSSYNDGHSSAGGSSHGGGLLLSPPPHSAASTHSSVFSDNNDQALLFGIPPPLSPYFSPSSASGGGNGNDQLQSQQQQSIDQALASLLGTNTNSTSTMQNMPSRDGASTPQPLGLGMQNTFSPNHLQQQQSQLQQMFSPNHQQQQVHQMNLGISSPPLSPLQNNNMTSPAQPTWAPYQQQSNLQQNLLPNIDPALQGLSPRSAGRIGNNDLNQQNLNLLSPQSAHFGNNGYNQSAQQTILGNGRPISSPRRLRGMQSAPDLNAMYSDNGFNDAFGITSTSPSPRKPSLKRGRGGNQYNGDSDEENHQSGNPYQYGEVSSDLEDEDDDYYQPGDRPPPRKRANSIHSSAGGGKMDPSHYQVGNGNNAVAAVLLPLVNPNPARLRPGPKPKTSLPNLQAAHQGVFQVSPRAPPVPSFPTQYLAQAPTYQATSPNPSNAGSTTTTAACLSPDPDTGYLKPQGGVSKDMLATFYSIGTGSKQTKKGKPQRMYVCSIPGCEKEFPRKSAVESHIQTHLEDKPFACPYDDCGASFVRSHDLTRHVRIHSGSKPFQCICGKGFARGDALTRHRQRGICEGSLVPRRW